MSVRAVGVFFLRVATGIHSLPAKGSLKNKFAELTLRFRSYLVAAIEWRRRNSGLFRGRHDWAAAEVGL